MGSDIIQAFIDRWATSGGAERGSFPLFPVELGGALEGRASAVRSSGDAQSE
jgi:hypothetical protein